MFKKRVKVSNSKDATRFFEEEFWVDTGALYSFVPEDHLEKIGVEPSAKRNLILADGRQDTRLLGFGLIPPLHPVDPVILSIPHLQRFNLHPGLISGFRPSGSGSVSLA